MQTKVPPTEAGVDHLKFRALESRVAALESELHGIRTSIQWVVALIFVVPVGLLIILRVWS